ncbi:precorrin-6A reductase [Treponema sp. TIM-1]|uniref:precorrin-6A reductase n=1 Tax=Treponema sp. TIM-1 TaxID=2898417 RepID=UPI0039816512
MTEFFVFAGTTEGRLFIEEVRRSVKSPCRLRVFTATEYGKELLEEGEGRGGSPLIDIRPGRLDAAGIYGELLRHRPDYVIDCTHPYAVEVTRNIRDACARAQCRYLRLQREALSLPREIPVRRADTMAAAAAFLAQEEGGILLTTGSKDLESFARPELRDRVFIRILPLEEGIRKCRTLGFSPSRVIALQGPFQEDFNRALLRHTGVSWLVTKETGEEGGLLEKIRAAQKEGVTVVILKRPAKAEGYTLPGIMEILRKEFPAFFVDERGG